MSPLPLRRSQAVAPFGVGAMVDFPGPVSLIHAGLDAWPFDENKSDHHEFRIADEHRLARRLGVDYFVLPPDFRRNNNYGQGEQPNLQLKIPFLRFPRWHVCPRCGLMTKFAFHDRTPPTCEGPIATGKQKGQTHKKRKMVQVRFIAACPKGHLQDFPWYEWVFSNPMAEETGRLRMISSGIASLSGVKIVCEEKSQDIVVIKSRSLGGAYGSEPGESSALSRLGVQCRAENPSLAQSADNGGAKGDCDGILYPLLRGGANVYFPHVVSSIYIPEISDASLSQDLLDLLDDFHVKDDLLSKALDSDNGTISSRMVKGTLKKYRPESHVDLEQFTEAANRHLLVEKLKTKNGWKFLQQSALANNGEVTSDMVGKVLQKEFPDWEIDAAYLSVFVNEHLKGRAEELNVDQGEETGYRAQEYSVLIREIQEGTPKTNLLIKSFPIQDYSGVVPLIFDRVSLVHKLRETRAFTGFSRIFPENRLSREQKLALLTRTPKHWLPGVVVRGEGIFLVFNRSRIEKWQQNFEGILDSRVLTMNRALNQIREFRNQEPRIVDAQFVLLHTFAHLLINQLIYECGYGSASLRERIYSSPGKEGMSGILIYTAAGDSEGTMGGLVRMGKPGYLEGAVARAIEKAHWCSTDPVCIESKGQGPDNCNLAACHACSLLPETSCEEQSRLLDRGLLVGTLEHQGIGFFSDFRGHNTYFNN